MSSDLLTPPDDDRQKPLFTGESLGSEYNNDFERMRARDHTDENSEDVDEGSEDNEPTKKFDSDQLDAAESAGAGAVAGSAETIADSPEAEEATNFTFKGGRKPFSAKGLAKKKWVWAGAGGGTILVVGLVLLFLLVGQFKAISFGNILAASGYARFNGIFQERTTQDIFDASVSQGEGSTVLRGQSLVDKFKLRNLDSEMARLGRNDQFKLTFKDNELATVKIGDQNISLDAITKEQGFGDSFSKASFRERLTIRREFTARTEVAVNDTFALEPSYLRGRIFGTISDNIGFKFSRWRQAARDYFGKDPVAADTQNKVETQTEVGGDTTVQTGVDAIDTPAKSAKTEAKLKSFLEKNGNEFNQQKFTDAILKDSATASQIGNAVGAVAPAVLVLSLACMANEAFGKIPQIYNQNVAEAERQGLAVLAARDQIKYGDVTSEVVGAANHQLDGGENSPYYQAAIGQPIDTAAHVPNIKPKFSPSLVTAIRYVTNPLVLLAGPLAPFVLFAPPSFRDSLGKDFCHVLLSPQGQIVFGVSTVLATFVVGALTAGAGAAAEQGGSWIAVQTMVTALKEAVFATASDLVSVDTLQTVGLFTAYSFGLQYIVDMFAGVSISGAQSGPDYVTNAFIGTNFEQSAQLQTLYGRPVTTQEAQLSDHKYSLIDQQSEANKGAFNRYFSSNNPYSLASIASLRVPTSFATVADGFRSSLANIGRIFQPQIYFGILSHPTGQAAYAAANFDPYAGMTQIGFSPDEQYKMADDPTYSMTENQNYITQAQIDSYDQDTELAKCFDPKTKTTPSELQDLQKPGNKCSADYLKQDSLFRYRIYKLDNVIGDQLNQPLTNAAGATASN